MIRGGRGNPQTLNHIDNSQNSTFKSWKPARPNNNLDVRFPTTPKYIFKFQFFIMIYPCFVRLYLQTSWKLINNVFPPPPGRELLTHWGYTILHFPYVPIVFSRFSIYFHVLFIFPYNISYI